MIRMSDCGHHHSRVRVRGSSSAPPSSLRSPPRSPTSTATGRGKLALVREAGIGKTALVDPSSVTQVVAHSSEPRASRCIHRARLACSLEIADGVGGELAHRIRRAAAVR
jgi:hypothetical protein